MSSSQLALILTILGANFTIGFYILMKNRRSLVHRAFFIFTLGIALYGMGLTLLFLTKIFIFDKFIFYGGLLLFLGLILLAEVFPDKQTIDKKFPLVLIPWFLTLIVLPFNLIVRGIVINKSGSLVPMLGPLFPVFAVIFGFYTILAFVLFFRHYRLAHGLPRLQMQYLFLGAAIFITSMFTFNVILPAFGIFTFNLLGPASSIIFVLAIAYAIVRHRFLDIRVVIQRGLIFTAIFILIAGLYLSIIFSLGLFFEKWKEITPLAAGMATALLGIFTVPWLESRFRHLTDKIFFKDKYNYSRALYELSDILNKNLDLEKLRGSAEQSLARIFRTEAASMILEGEERESWGETSVPIVLDKVTLGTIMIGPKRSGDAYTEEDFTLLKTFSRQAAVAIEKAKLYEKIKIHSQELEERVRERTTELRTLQEGQRQMMIDISHGLQTPLTIVRGELNTLKTHTGDNPKITHLEASIDRASKSIYDLLRLSRLESGSVDFKKESVKLSSVMRNIIEYADIVAKEKGIEIKGNVEPNIEIAGDEDRLEELITALVSNAMKYTEDSPIKEIRVGLKRDGKFAELTVTDTGIGIDADDLPHVFERFYRVKNAYPEGTGLGLAIAKTIVERHGGAISATSIPKKGTAFSVRFPTGHTKVSTTSNLIPGKFHIGKRLPIQAKKVKRKI